MLGFAMTTAAERDRPAQTLDDTVNAYLSKNAVMSVSLVGVVEQAGTDAYLGFG